MTARAPVVRELPFVFPRGPMRWLVPVVRQVPWLGRHRPTVTRVRFARRVDASAGELR